MFKNYSSFHKVSLKACGHEDQGPCISMYGYKDKYLECSQEF